MPSPIRCTLLLVCAFIGATSGFVARAAPSSTPLPASRDELYRAAIAL